MVKTKLQFSIGVLLLCILMYIATFSIKVTESVLISASFFPRLIIAITAILAIIYMIPVLKELKNGAVEEKEKGNTKRLFITMIMCVIYGILFDILGFIASSIIYLIIQMWIMLEVKSRKELTKFATISVIAVVSIYLLFTKLFFVALPSGSVF